MKKHCLSLLALVFCAFPSFASDTISNSAATFQPSDLSSGIPLQGKLSDSAQQQMIRPQTTPGGYAIPTVPVQQYQERSMQPSVLNAPPAWAQDSFLEKSTHMLAPFGANLFQGNFSGTYSDGMDGSYTIMPGDRIVVRIWGAKVFNDVLPVDQQGNIFLPEVGPVHVAGVSQSALQRTVSAKLASVFTSNVNIYVNLQSSQPVAVYVAGFVNRPGRYAGSSADSVMSFLDRAGGITPNRGTFRTILVKRGKKTIESLDLYDFALKGEIPDIRLKSGDVILVGERGISVSAYGLIRQEARYEFTGSRPTGSQLIRYAKPLAGVTHVSVSGVRQGLPFHNYMPLSELQSLRLADGDAVEFVADIRGKTILASVSGAIRGESRFPVKSSTTLRDILSYIEVDPVLASVKSVYVRRQSVAQQQKAILQDALRRLEQSTLTATSATSEEAEIRIKEAQLVQNFVQRAAALTPDGIVVVSRNGRIGDLVLEDGDEIVIPQYSDVIQISGEVIMPKAIAYDPAMKFEDYITGAGGFTPKADTSSVLVARLNGEIGLVRELGISRGDRILVLPRVESKNLALAKGLSQILYQIAIAAKVAIGL
ncbi:MAG: polysaccharide biosynthesis/export family protein [Desulfovibrionaceae bacterium]|nr:polysaccharide biosynthesis/export family protein [Desulfovibrionaceae bacterium]